MGVRLQRTEAALCEYYVMVLGAGGGCMELNNCNGL